MADNYYILETIKFKLTRAKLVAIYHANQSLSCDMFARKEDQVLINALLYSLQRKVAKRLLDNKKELSITFSVPEAIAFFKLHTPHSANYDMYTFSAIHPLLSDIQSKLI